MTTGDADVAAGRHLRTRWWNWWAAFPAGSALVMVTGIALYLGVTAWGAVVGALCAGCVVTAVVVRRRYVVLEDGAVGFRSWWRRRRIEWEDVEQVALEAGGADRRIELTTSTGTVRLPALRHEDDASALAAAFQDTLDDDAPMPDPRRYATRGFLISRSPPAPGRRMPVLAVPRVQAWDLPLISLLLAGVHTLGPFTSWLGAVFLVAALLGVGGAMVDRRQYVRLQPDGSGVTYRSLREHQCSWDDVRDVTVDPPGGVRVIRLHLVSGATRRLPTPRYDRDAAAVEQAFRAAKARREAAADESVSP